MSIIHMIWLGESMPLEVRYNAARWKIKYGKDFKLWRDADLVNYIDLYNLNPNWHPAIKADFLRIKIILDYGGWYVDADTHPGNEMMKMEYKSDIFLLECSNQLTNSVFYGRKGSLILNELWSALIATQRSKIEKYPKDVMTITGPIWLTNMLRKLLAVEEFKAEVIFINLKKFPHFVASKKKLKKKSYLLFHEGANSWSESKSKIISSRQNIVKQHFIQSGALTVILRLSLIQKLSLKQIILNRGNVEFLDRMSTYSLIEIYRSLKVYKLDPAAAKNFNLSAEWEIESSKLHAYLLLILNLFNYSKFHSKGNFVMSKLNPK